MYIFLTLHVLPPLFRICDQIKIHHKLSSPMDHLQRVQKLLMIISLHAYRNLSLMDHWQNKLQQELCQCVY